MTIAATLLLIGRVVLGLFFVIAGLRNFMHFREPGRATPATNYGFKVPAPITALGFAAQLLGGLSVTFGIAPAWGAALLILFRQRDVVARHGVRRNLFHARPRLCC